MKTNNRNLTSILVISIVVIGSLIRLYKLSSFSFWTDEVSSINTIFGQNLSIHSYPIFYLITKIMFQWFGLSEFTARIIPCLIGIISIYLTYLCTKLIFDRRTGIIASALVSINTWHIFFSQSARFYIFLYLIALISLTAFMYAIEKNNRKFLILALFLTLLAPLFHTTGIFLFFIYFFFFVIMIFRKNKPESVNLKNMLIFSTPLLVSIVVLPRIIAAISRYFKVGPDRIFLPGIDNIIYVLMGIVYYIGTPLFIIGLICPFVLILSEKNRGILFSLFIGAPLILILAAGYNSPSHARYLFFSFPAYIMLASFALNQLLSNFSHVRNSEKIQSKIYSPMFKSMMKHSKRNFFLISVLVILAIFSIYLKEDFLYFARYNGYRPMWKEACESFRSELKDGDIVMTPEIQMPMFYLSEKEEPFRKFKKDLTFTTFALKGSKIEGIKALEARIWFIVDYTAIHKYGPDEKTLNWIKRNSESISEFNIYMGPRNRSLRVYFYRPQKDKGRL